MVDMPQKDYRAESLEEVNHAWRARHTLVCEVTCKLCRICLTLFPLSMFGKHKQTKDGLENRCKRCQRDRALSYYYRHVDKILQKERSFAFRKRKRAYLRQWERNKLKTDVQFRLRKRLRTRLHKGLSGARKEYKTQELLGCSFTYLKTWLEDRFSEGMSWDNYGKGGWEIDHVKPLSSFDLTKKEAIFAACNYTNLQPLWRWENIAKGRKI